MTNTWKTDKIATAALRIYKVEADRRSKVPQLLRSICRIGAAKARQLHGYMGALKMRDWKMRDWNYREQETNGTPRVA